MNIISCYKLLLMVITQPIHISEQIRSVNVGRSVDVCKGNDVDLLWKVDEGKDTISSLDWYFNDIQICNSSPIENFTVSTVYQSRIERINKTDIRLKNVSLDDEGTYILFPSLTWSTSLEMTISIRVLEPPTDKCFHKRGILPDFGVDLQESYCGRPKVSFVWKRNQTAEVLDKEIHSCLDGEAMKCVADKSRFCINLSIFYQHDERPFDDGKIQDMDSASVPAFSDRCYGSKDFDQLQSLVLANLILTSILVVLKVAPVLEKERKNRKAVGKIKNLWKRNWKLNVKPKKNNDPELEDEEAIPMNESETETRLERKKIIALCPRAENEKRLLMNPDTNHLEIETHCQKMEKPSPWTKFRPEKAIPMNQAKNDSDMAMKSQTLQHITLHKRHFSQ